MAHFIQPNTLMYTFSSNLTYKGRTLSDRTEWSELPPTHLFFFFLLLLYVYLLGVSCLTSSHTEFITRKKMETKRNRYAKLVHVYACVSLQCTYYRLPVKKKKKKSQGKKRIVPKGNACSADAKDDDGEPGLSLPLSIYPSLSRLCACALSLSLSLARALLL